MIRCEREFWNTDKKSLLGGVMSNTDEFPQVDLSTPPQVMVEQSHRVRVLVDLQGILDPDVSIRVGTKKKSWFTKIGAAVAKLFSWWRS